MTPVRLVAAVRGAVALSLFWVPPACAQGHGPVYGLSTPTLGRGGWSLDTALMGRFVDDEEAIMMRPMVSYGLTEDVQISASIPVRLDTGQGFSAVRGLTRMPMTSDAQLMLGWRFHRNAVSVGARWESTAWVAFEYPTDDIRAAVEPTPGLFGAAVTGYASRSFYAWVGAAYRRYLAPADEGEARLGNMSMASLVVGYRPPAFRKDYPHADWRAFLELVGEWMGENTVNGADQVDTGGRQVFLGLTVLGLYGSWGVSGGPAVPVYQRTNGDPLRERLRFAVNFTLWF